MIEARGIATVVIGLVRPQIERTPPPRALWVPFPLGRPLGEPEDAQFQRRVLLTALGLLERADGPRILVDFPDDAPGMRDDPEWRPAVAELTPLPLEVRSAERWAAAVNEEVAAFGPAVERFRAARGRTTVGASRLAPAQWSGVIAAFLGPAPPASPVDGVSAAVAMRLAADDLKAYCREAAIGPTGRPSIAQIDTWLWRQTRSGALLKAVRARGLEAPEGGFKTVAARFLVPAPFIGG